MSEHPIALPIRGIDVDWSGKRWEIGCGGVTRIEGCEKSGMYSSIPYLRVYKGDECAAELCQHNVVSIDFDTSQCVAIREQRQKRAEAGICLDCGETPCNCIPF